MDGFESDVAVIVLGATNRPEILDPRCCGPGRFDRRVAVPPPDKDGPAQDPRGPHALAAARPTTSTSTASPPTTPGMVGADLANLANEAALTAARRNHEQGRSSPTSPTRSRRSSSAPRAARCCSEEDRRRVAYHEGGHAIVGMLTPGRRPGPQGLDHPARDGARRDALGARRSTRPTTRRPTCSTKIKVALGGRVAEEIVYGTITTGAESDIEQLTGIARAMVGRWGMSRVDRADRGAAQRGARAAAARARRRCHRRRSG